MAIDLTKLTFENLKKKIKREPISFTGMIIGATLFVTGQFIMPKYRQSVAISVLSVGETGATSIIAIPLAIIFFIIAIVFGIKFFEK